MNIRRRTLRMEFRNAKLRKAKEKPEWNVDKREIEGYENRLNKSNETQKLTFFFQANQP